MQMSAALSAGMKISEVGDSKMEVLLSSASILLPSSLHFSSLAPAEGMNQRGLAGGGLLWALLWGAPKPKSSFWAEATTARRRRAIMVLLVGWEPGDWLLARKQAGNTAPIEVSRRRALQHGALSRAVQCSVCV